MPNIFGLRNGLYTPKTETMCALPTAAAFGNGSSVCGTHYSDPFQPIIQLATSTLAFLYNPRADGWVNITNPAFTGTLSVADITWNPNGPTGTVSAATPNSITTNYTSARDLRQYSIRITAGAGKGQERVVSYNTIGAGAIFTVTQPWDIQPDATSTWVLRTGRFYVFASTGTVIGFKYFDVASMSWASLSTTGVPSTWVTSAAVCAPHCSVFATNSPSGAITGGASTITDAGKNWLTNQWSNQQVRITSGAGAGQTRTISSNTPTTLTVSLAWTIQPDSSSVYGIGANEDYIYLVGNGAGVLYRYSISSDTWVTLSPVVARATSAAAGCSLTSVDQETDPLWTDETNYLNGRYLYSFRGGGTDSLTYYDVAFNTWYNDAIAGGGNPISYAGRVAFTTGASYVYQAGTLYAQVGGLGALYKFYPAQSFMEPWLSVSTTTLSAVNGKKMAVIRYVSGNTILKFVYTGLGGLTNFLRIQDI
jgi:hypothetical protein